MPAILLIGKVVFHSSWPLMRDRVRGFWESFTFLVMRREASRAVTVMVFFDFDRFWRRMAGCGCWMVVACTSLPWMKKRRGAAVEWFLAMLKVADEPFSPMVVGTGNTGLPSGVLMSVRIHSDVAEKLESSRL